MGGEFCRSETILIIGTSRSLLRIRRLCLVVITIINKANDPNYDPTKPKGQHAGDASKPTKE